MGAALNFVGRQLAAFLSRPLSQGAKATTSAPEMLAASLRPADVLLIEGNTRISAAIKYLTQSTWSHAALYVGDTLGAPLTGEEPLVLIEADLTKGVRAVPLSEYAYLRTRICRPVGLTPEDREKVIGYTVSRLGHRYDLKNLIDLARYLLPTPPVPARWRRRMLALGSGDPTRAICSTLIAQAFQSVRYPILPKSTREMSGDPAHAEYRGEILHIRHHSLYAPRDFDISPYFEVVKPAIAAGFDYRSLRWSDRVAAANGDLLPLESAPC
jgi:cell wall-associated NlpC family hydrolase